MPKPVPASVVPKSVIGVPAAAAIKSRPLAVWIVGVALLVAGCSAAPAPMRTAATDPYQACLYRGYQIGNLPYAATTFYQAHAIDRIWTPMRSPVAECDELRSRGQL